MSGNDTFGKWFGVCFIIIWIVIAVGMGMSAASAGAPPMFVLVPLAMAGIGVMLVLGIATGKFGDTAAMVGSLKPVVIREPSGSGTPVVYTPPPNCPNCGAPLSDETVEWVGPLQAKCPSCGHTVEAKKRVL